MGTKKNKRVVVAAGVAPNPGDSKRVPRVLSGVVVDSGQSNYDEHPVWGLMLLDHEHEGSWSWAMEQQETWKLLMFLKDIERLRWSEIRGQTTGGREAHKKHHDMPADSLCKEAKERLHAIGMGDQEQLFRFRLSNTERLWGLIINHVFYPVWWDKAHKVYPLEN